MDNTNYAQILSERILFLRKEKGLTQEALAQQLGVSFQAVSKWENEQSCPDIALLPLLAEIFEVTVDSLFGREAKAEPPAEEGPSDVQGARREEEWGNNPVFSAVYDVPWPDDQILRGVVYWGRKLLSHEIMPNKQFVFDINRSEYTWLLRYSPLNVHAECSLAVEGNVQGNATVGSHMRCNDIGGEVNVGSHMTCRDVLKGSVNAGSHVSCGSVGGSAGAGSHITCGNVGGNADAGAKIECGSIGGNAKALKIVVKK